MMASIFAFMPECISIIHLFFYLFMSFSGRTTNGLPATLATTVLLNTTRKRRFHFFLSYNCCIKWLRYNRTKTRCQCQHIHKHVAALPCPCSDETWEAEVAKYPVVFVSFSNAGNHHISTENVPPPSPSPPPPSCMHVRTYVCM